MPNVWRWRLRPHRCCRTPSAPRRLPTGCRQYASYERNATRSRRCGALAGAARARQGRHRRFAWIGTVASAGLFGASLVVLWFIVSEVDANELKAAFTAASARQIGLAVLLTAVSYGLLMLRRSCPSAAQAEGPLPHDGARVVHQLRGELHARLSAADRRHGALLDLCSPRPRGRRRGEPHGDRRHHLLARHGARARLEPDAGGRDLAPRLHQHQDQPAPRTERPSRHYRLLRVGCRSAVAP